jgi:hypothetical protein
MSREPPNWYDHNADNPPWSNAPAEVRLLAPRERCCFLHAQAIIVAIDQHAVKALGNREYFLDRAGSAENGEFQAKPVAPCIEPPSHEAVVFERLQDAVSGRPRQTDFRSTSLGNLKPMSQRIAVVHIDSIMRNDARPTGDAWHNGRVVADLRGGLHATLKQGPYDTFMDECITHGQTAFRDKMRHPCR